MVVLVLSLVVLIFLAQRSGLGYARPTSELAHLSRGEAALLGAAGATFVPETGGQLARAGHEVDVPVAVDRHLQALSPEKRREIRALLLLFEHATLLFPARGVGGFRRFSSLSDAQRAQVLEGWATSGLYLRRALFSALKGVVVLAYVSDDANRGALHVAPFEITSPIIEADLLYPPIGSSGDDIAYGPDDLTDVHDTTPLSGQTSDGV